MSESFLVFKVEQQDRVTIITNNSDYDLWISLVPIKPKRKYYDIRVVPTKSYTIYDDPNFDITKVSFRLMNKYEAKE